MPIIRRDNTGRVFTTTSDGVEHNLTPRLLREEQSSNSRLPTEPTGRQFKLITVRRLATRTTAELQTEVANSYTQLEAAALRTGQPVPYPYSNVTQANSFDMFGVFIDEDLDGISNSIYSFQSPSGKVKAYIHCSGSGNNDWIVSLCHYVNKEATQDGGTKTNWRIVTIENSEQGRIFHILEDSALPECFSQGIDIDALHYLGGGCWSGMAVDNDDKKPLIAIAPADSNRYIPVGTVFTSAGWSKVRSIVSYSLTPTYVFTWNRGSLVFNKRIRECSQEGNFTRLSEENVLEYTKKHDYTLVIPHRVPYAVDNINIKGIDYSEFSRGQATYIGNMNIPEIASTFQMPDYTTDKKRLSISSLEMNTNVIRPKTYSYSSVISSNLHSRCPVSYIPVLASNYNSAVILRQNLGEASGNINFYDETKYTTGKRGFQYGEDYKYWWAYGIVLETYPIGDTKRYRELKSPGFDENGNQLPAYQEIGSMFDLGELLIDSELPNRVMTTWDARSTPYSGFFSRTLGDLTFTIVSKNPPIFGHQGIYYYHINPPAVGTAGGAYETESDGSRSERRNMKNVALSVYSQMLGGLSGGAVPSLDIGTVSVGGKDKETTIARQPSVSQKSALWNNPETFPAGYFDSDYIWEFTLDNENVGNMTLYDYHGNFVSSSVF